MPLDDWYIIYYWDPSIYVGEKDKYDVIWSMFIGEVGFPRRLNDFLTLNVKFETINYHKDVESYMNPGAFP